MHFGHANAIKFDHRPWNDIETMEKALIERWNSVVTPLDTVYHLGDFSWGSFVDWSRVLKQLNGHKVFIKGNHDKFTYLNMAVDQGLISAWHYQYEYLDEKRRYIIMNHCPMPFFGNQRFGSIHLYGHVHVSDYDAGVILDLRDKIGKRYGVDIKMYNVGCMVQDYIPRSLDEIMELDKTQKFVTPHLA